MNENETGSGKYDIEDIKNRCLDYMKSYRGELGQLQDDVQKSLRIYRAEGYGDEVEGRSAIVMSDAFDTIEWIKPALMRIFYGGTDVVKISARGPEDEIAADLLGEKINWDFQTNNNGFIILYDFFDDALKSKVGFIKYWWEKVPVFNEKQYAGLTEEEFQMLQQKENFVIDSSEPKPQMAMDQMGMPVQFSTYDVKGSEISYKTGPRAEVVPFEEMIFRPQMKRIADEDYVCHIVRKHKSEVAQTYGLEESEIQNEIDVFARETLTQERYKDLGGITFLSDATDRNFVYLYEQYIKWYTEGGPVSLKVVQVGNKILSIEENQYQRPPFVCGTPIRMAHREIGRSMVDLTADLQKLKTYLVRSILDNIYYQNSGINIVNPYRINLGDMINNRFPGGIVRTNKDVDATTAIWPVPIASLPKSAYDLLPVVDSWKENRTGVTKYNQGTDANSLNKTAAGISQIMSASQQRIELIARIFAETGLKDLFNQFAWMNITFLDEPTNIRLNQQWVMVNPNDIDCAYDVTIDVGIGTGSKELMVQQLTSMLQTSLPLTQLGIVGPQNVYEILKSIYEAMGYKNIAKYLTPPQPPPPMAMGPGGMNGAGPEQAGIPEQFATGGFGGPGGQEAAGQPPPQQVLQ
jgi:hypothetical protein